MIIAINTDTGKYASLPIDIFSNEAYSLVFDHDAGTFRFEGSDYLLSTIIDTIKEKPQECDINDLLTRIGDSIQTILDNMSTSTGSSVPEGHTHDIAEVNQLSDVLTGLQTSITALEESLADKAGVSHSHVQSDITDVEFEVVFVYLDTVLQYFPNGLEITAIDAVNIDSLLYDVNESGTFVELDMVNGLPLAVQAGSTITWSIAYSRGKDKASMNIKGKKL